MDLLAVNARWDHCKLASPPQQEFWKTSLWWQLIERLFFFLNNNPIHPDNRKRFTFSVLSPNNTAPMRQFQGTILPQGMANSPTMRQYFVNVVLHPARIKFLQTYLVHCMDVTLLAISLGRKWQCLYEYTLPGTGKNNHRGYLMER